MADLLTTRQTAPFLSRARAMADGDVKGFRAVLLDGT
jgi:hypothetical protein